MASERKKTPKTPAGRKPAKRKATKMAGAERREHPDVLERGDIFFLYRPAAGDATPTGILDVGRFHLALRPEGGEAVRLLTIGRKMLPDEGDPNHWAFVERAVDDPEELGRALCAGDEPGQGDARQQPAVRPAGEGVYALARRGRDTVLAYILELPDELGEVQEAFRIAREGRFVISVKNPAGGSPGNAGLDDDRKAEFPEDLAAKFGARKWLPVDPPAFLDHEGAEVVLIAGRGGEGDADEFGLDPQPEDLDSAELFEALRIGADERSARPLIEGEWA